MRGARTRELVIAREELNWFREIMFYMDIRIRDTRPGVNEKFVIIRYVCGEYKQKKMMIASAKIFKKMRA